MEINNSGFVIFKTPYNISLIKKIKQELNVSPFNNFEMNGFTQKKYFKVYIEDQDSITVPIFYAIKELKLKPDNIYFDKINKNNNLSSSIKLRENQLDCFNNSIKEFKKEYGGGIISLNTGMGKCLAKDTEVVMFSGELKKVQDIKKGEFIMGDDSEKRKILSTIKGEDELYTIKSRDYSYTVNKDHILVLKNINEQPLIHNRIFYYFVSWWSNNKLINKRFSSKKKAEEYKDILIKHKSNQIISEISVKEYLKMSKSFKSNFKGFRVAVNFPHKNTLKIPYYEGKYFNVSMEDSVDPLYKYNSFLVREQFLEGIFTNYFVKNIKKKHKTIYFIDNKNILLDIIYICRSLGKNVSINLKNKYLVLWDKQVDHYDFTLKYYKIGDYYGFTIDKNRRFLIGDFSVTHNTVVSLKMIEENKTKTIIIVNKIELMNQWEKEIKKWMPYAKVGVIQGKRFIFENCDIVIGMLQTISLNSSLTHKDFKWVETVFIDECHNVAAEMFSKIMFKIRPKFLFGLTATLERKDKLDKIIKWYMGDILYDGTDKDSLKQTSEIKILKYIGGSSIEKYQKNGNIAISTMISKIAIDKERSDYIIKILLALVKENSSRNVLVISDRIDQLKYFYSNLGNEVSGLFIGSMKADDLEYSKTKRIILGTYGLVNEGFNLVKLNCLLFATPRSSIVQAIGRIYRKKHDIKPIIIDVVDDFSVFKAQHYKRKRIYKKSIQNCCISEQQLKDFNINQKPLLLDTSSDEEDMKENCLIIE